MSSWRLSAKRKASDFFRTAVGNYHARKLRLRRQLGLPFTPMRPLRLDHTKNRASAGRRSQECRRSSFRNSAARQPNGAPPANTNAVGKGRRRPSPPAPAQRETPASIQPTSFRRGPSEGIAATARDSHQRISPRCHTCSSILAAAREMASFFEDFDLIIAGRIPLKN